MFSSLNRITGLSGSGFDVEGTVEKLMQAQRAKYDKMFQRQKTLAWTKEAYREMNTSLAKMRDSASKMKLQGTFMVKKASSSDETKVTATGSAVAVDGTSSIKIAQLAESVTKMSTGKVTVAGGNPITLDAQFGLNASASSLGDDVVALSFKINGHTFEYTKKDLTDIDKNIYTVVSDINAADIGVRASYDPTVDRIFISTSNTGSNQTIVMEDINITGGVSNFLGSKLKLYDPAALTNLYSSTGVKVGSDPATSTSKISELGLPTSPQNFTIEVAGIGKGSFSIDNTMTLTDLVNKLNADENNFDTDGNGTKDAKMKDYVKVSFSEASGTFSLVAIGTAVGSNITWTDDAGSSLKSKLNLSHCSWEAGKDAEIYLNGMDADDSLKIVRDTNSFNINGITYNLKNTSTDFVKINVNTDVDAVFDNIKKFIDDYNSTIDTIYNEITEEKYRDYKPLTDQQKESMKEDDIKLWEEKAKSGLLRSDGILRTALDRMRNNMTSLVNGVIKEYQFGSKDLGLVTGDYTSHGKIYFSDDTGDKLKEAIRNNPDAIVSLFTKNGDTDADKGIGRRIYETMDSAIKTINEKAGFTTMLYDDSELGKQIDDLNDKMIDEKNRLIDVENRYWRQFTAMETALSKMNSQSAWLSQQLGG